MDKNKKDRFLKGVRDVESLNKAEISGPLEDYFTFTDEPELIKWRKSPPSLIKSKIEQIANEFLK